jgi:hypothetical protein
MPSSSTTDRRKALHAAEEDTEKRGRKWAEGGKANEGETSTKITGAAADEYVTPAVDGQLLRQAYQARKARVEELSQFRSRRGKQRSEAGRNGGKVREVNAERKKR